jgi:hypothetical protein
VMSGAGHRHGVPIRANSEDGGTGYPRRARKITMRSIKARSGPE